MLRKPNLNWRHICRYSAGAVLQIMLFGVMAIQARHAILQAVYLSLVTLLCLDYQAHQAHASDAY